MVNRYLHLITSLRCVAFRLLPVVLLLLTLTTAAQTPDLLIRAGNINGEEGVAIAKDASDNIYITGSFSGVVTFGSTTLTSAGSGDIFVAKYSAAGSLLWALRAGGDELDVGNGITVDNSGVYITGRFEGIANFNTPSNPASNTLISDGDSDIFVAGFDVNTGQLLWAQRAGGSKSDNGKGITVYNGGIYVTGSFSGTANFNTPSSPTSHTLVSTAQDQGLIGDIFVAKYDAAGTVQWLRRAGGEYNNSNIGITADISGVYVTGSFSGTANFNTPSDPASNTLISAGRNLDIFVAKYNDAGMVQWLRRAGGSGSDVGLSITVANSMIYVTGQIQNIANFNTPSDPASNTLISASPNTDIFVAKYNAAGMVQWLRRAGGSASDYGTGIAADISGVYVSGQFTNIADFNTPSDPASNTLVSSDLDTEIFVAKYDDAGMVQWFRRIGGRDLEFVNGIVAGNAGVFVTGSFSGTVDFNTPSDPTRNTLVSAGSADIFLARLSNLPVLAITGFAATATTVCAGNAATFTATIGNVTGGYDYTLTNGISSISGSATATPFSQTLAATLTGTQTYTLHVRNDAGTGQATTVLTVNEVPSLTLTAAPSLTLSQGGSVTLTASGAQSYTWTGGSSGSSFTASPAVTTVYSVTGVNAPGCADVASTTVTVNALTPVISAVGVVAATVCSGRPATFTATPGNVSGIYSFTLTNGSSPVSGTATGTAFSQTLTAAGSGVQTYTLTIGASGTTVSASTTLTVSASPVAAISLPAGLTVTCAVPVISVTATGGVGYRWENGTTSAIRSLSTGGTYSVTVTGSSGCTASASEVITQNTQPPAGATLTASSGGTLTCGKRSLTLTAGATGSGLSYSFSGPGILSQTGSSATINAAGTYSVVVTGSNGCTALALTTVVSKTAAPSVSINPASASISCASPLVSLSAIGAGTVRWSTGETSAVISVSVADTYSVTLTDGGGCTAVTGRVVSGSLLGAATVIAGSPIGCGVTTTTVQIAAQGAASFTLLEPNGYSQTNNTGDFSVSAGGSYTGLAGQAGCVVSNTVVVIQGGVQPTISSAQATGTLGSGSCSVPVQAAGYGDRYVLTGPGGYVFSVVYRTAGERSVSFPAVVRPGTYTLTVYSGNCVVIRPVAVTGTSCP